ncbi:exosome nuclease subunit [Pseudogymnoascus destructans]|uniref:HRDC domain-containing protein n=2 Tax=Pseudogymnoascus destructans TaxID=655981 RepID=L8GBM4_PSED2|nr:exosome nuclease subunit [Pseudogymnoascus destructans]ELR10279.1 hypothetical protein GMDG_04665 [Pseudogymnoascus destructans 20631-21]OAF57470.1 exosome nuclease subunit [Pseudogymnoascus destructans]
MEGPPGFKSLQDAIQAALISTTRTVGQISAEDLGFHRSLNPEVGTALDEQNARLLGLSSSILQSAAALTESNAPVLQEVDDVDNNWRGVVDVVDSLLERVDICLDEYTGVIQRKASPAENSSAPKSRRLDNSFRTQNLVKPQLSFLNKPANHETGPWKPLLHSKPHAIVPLEESLGPVADAHQQEHYRHPYETEIEKLKYPASVYKNADPIPYLPVESTSATFVDTYEGVLEMLAELRTAKEIAIDLEHHDARSYTGLVSLMQISTREKDWIVDTLKPWRQDLQVLNEVFTDPKILKVLHGAFMDILWLQRDLGLYIVGLFDTNHACKALGYAGGSLAFLLKKFIDFDADKKYQMADWRIRPLPEGMFFYARADTHFLLYIYDNMRNELVERSKPVPAEENRLEIVLRKSKETSLFRYDSPRYNATTGKGPGGWFQALVKVPSLLNNEQFAVFRAVHAWRDKIARQDDDSTNFVMANHTLLSVAKVMPTDMASLLGTVHPISYNVKARTGELLELIKAAKTNAKDGPSMAEVLKPDSVGAVAAANARSARASGDVRQSVLTILSGDAGGDMRSPQSAFWGRAFGSSTWEEPATLTKAGEDIRLAIPLPPLAEEAFSEGVREYSILAQPEVPEPEEEAPVVEEEAFTIKGGRKRKSDDMEEEVEGQAEEGGEYDISLHEPLEGAAKEKSLKKAERKAAKKAAKAAKRGDAESPRGAAKEEDDEEPFDYSKAESVMNKKRTNEYAGGKKGGKKPFDPYQKSADASTGMRRVQTERPGKSFTFKG